MSRHSFRSLAAYGFAISALVWPVTVNAQVLQSSEQGLGLSVTEDPQAGHLNLYRIEANGSTTLLHENIFPESTLNTFSPAASLIDNNTGKIYLKEPDQGGGLRYRIYNAATNQFEGYTTWTGLPQGGQPQFLGAAMQLNTVARREGEELHIGENSFITRERNGNQEIYARDANGNAIPLNVTNGSDLLINGVSVQGQIDSNKADILSNSSAINVNKTAINVNKTAISVNKTAIKANKAAIKSLGSGIAGSTALSSALAALPKTSGNYQYSCGVGSSQYSSRYAVGLGCSAGLTEQLAFNVGGSYLFGEQSEYLGASLDSAAVNAGFVYSFGKVKSKSPAPSEVLQQSLSQLEAENGKLKILLQKMAVRLEALESKL